MELGNSWEQDTNSNYPRFRINIVWIIKVTDTISRSFLAKKVKRRIQPHIDIPGTTFSPPQCKVSFHEERKQVILEISIYASATQCLIHRCAILQGNYEFFNGHSSKLINGQ